MPIYEYNCSGCGTDFEKLMSFSETTSPACPACDSTAVARQLGRPAIHFKGSGWYITDSKSSSKESANGGKNSKESESTETGSTSPKESTTDAGSTETSSASSSAPATSKAEKAMAAD